MKRFIKILGILLVLLVVAIIAIPYLFKDEITQKATQELNAHLKAEVAFQDLGVNLFSTFPNFLVKMDELTIDGKGTFEGTRLLELGTFEVELNIWSVLTGEEFEVESIRLENTTVNVQVLEDGTANYDIVKEEASSEEAEAEIEGETSAFKLALKSYTLENFNLNYVDKEGGISANLKTLNHNGRGDFTQDIVNLSTKTTIEALTVILDEVAYLNKVEVKSDFDVELNQNTSLLTFGKNHVDFNEVVLAFTGNLTLPDSAGNMNMDLTFDAPGNSFKSLLSLIPAIYTQDFSDLKSSGNFSLSGNIKGVYMPEVETYPSFSFETKVKEGTFQYPSLPASVSAVNFNLRVENNSNQLDATVIEMSEGSALVANSPINMAFKLSTPMSDPNFSASLKTNFQLENLQKVIPAQGYQYSGRLIADFSTAGRMSSIEAERYDEVQAQGFLKATNISLKGDSLPLPIQIMEAELNLSPQKASLDKFSAQIASSDMQANGELSNLMAYALKDEILKGSFSLSGNKLNLNELSGSSEDASSSEATAADTAALTAIRLPENIDFKVNANFKEVIYDNLSITNLTGAISLKEGVAAMQDVALQMLGGSMALSGSYNSVPTAPEVDLNLKLKDFGFKESFKAFNTIQQLAPVMENTTGTFSTGFSLKTKLNPDMSPDLASILAQGGLQTSKLVTQPRVMQKVADVLKNPSLSSLKLSAVNVNFKIEDGRVKVEPFKINAGNISGTVSGSNGLDQSLDYVMNLKLPASGIGAANLLNKIGAAQGGTVDLGINIGGTVTNPKISTSLGDLAKNAIDNLKNQATEKVKEVTKEAKQKVNDQSAKLIEEASKKGDELIAAAEQQANQIKSEAAKQAQRIKDEAEKRASKIEQEAQGNMLKERAAAVSAKTIRKTANDQAQKVIDEGSQQADKLVNEATQQKQKLIDDAKAKSQI
jgi:cell division septum initiation protein DivIVA